MSIESGRSPQKDPDSFLSCLVEGSGEQRARERRIRRRALIISVAVQSAILTAMVLFPLFGKPARIALAMTPIPPYYHSNAPERPDTASQQATQRRHNPFDPGALTQATAYSREDRRRPYPPSPDPPGLPTGPGAGAPCAGCVPMIDDRPQPQRPAEPRAADAVATSCNPPGTSHADPAHRTPLSAARATNSSRRPAWNCAPSSPPTARSNPCKWSAAIHSSCNPRSTPYGSGATAQPFSTASPWKSIRTSPSFTTCSSEPEALYLTVFAQTRRAARFF